MSERHRTERERLSDIIQAGRESYAVELSAPWANSPYAWLWSPSPSNFGLYMQDCIRQWAGGESAAPDISVRGVRYEVKAATVQDNGSLSFKQTRKHQDFPYILCGVLPHDVRAWVVGHDDIVKRSTFQLHSGTNNIGEVRFSVFTPPLGWGYGDLGVALDTLHGADVVREETLYS